jgi:hypothetical protein
MSTIDDAIQAIRMGDKIGGRQILEDILEADESNEEVWLWLSSVVDTDEDREICLENVLALNPDNLIAQRGLEALRSGTFNVHTIMGDALQEMEEEEEPGSFIEEFEIASDFDDDELVMPSSMKGGAAAGGGLASRINIRLLILVGLVFVVLVLAVGGIVASIFLGGDDTTVPGVDVQNTIDGGQPAIEEGATDTPTPLPTGTPTLTPTPFELPTSPPTAEPTPTATAVVQPTAN